MPLFRPEVLPAQLQASFEAQFLIPPSEAGWMTLRSARTFALWLQHPLINTGHLASGAANTVEIEAVFEQLGADPKKINSAVEFIIGRGDRTVLNPARGLSPNANAALELSTVRGREFGNRTLEPELMVLGIIDHGQNIGLGALESLGIRVSQLEAEMTRSLRQRVLGH